MSRLRRVAGSRQARDVLLLLVILVTVPALWFLTRDESPMDDDPAPLPPEAGSSVSAEAVPEPPPPATNGVPSVGPDGQQLTPEELQELLDSCTALTIPSDVVVVTYNIKSGEFGGRSRLGDIIAELTAMKPDIVLLQEVRGQDQPQAIASALGMTQFFGVNLQLGSGPGASYGTAVLSRFPLEGPVNVRLPNRAGLEQRGVLRARVSIQGTPLTIYGTHLQHTSPEVRLAQMQFVLTMMRQDTAAKILGGDLNASAGSPVLGAATAELTDTWPQVGVGSGATVPADRPRGRIDYLLYDQADDTQTTLAPVSAQVMGVGSSDHRAMRAVYRLTRTIEPACGQ